ncbi:MAG: hypothetical protein ACTSUJ_09190 [Candidatus Njordarchaeales archaeon]
MSNGEKVTYGIIKGIDLKNTCGDIKFEPKTIAIIGLGIISLPNFIEIAEKVYAKNNLTKIHCDVSRIILI